MQMESLKTNKNQSRPYLAVFLALLSVLWQAVACHQPSVLLDDLEVEKEDSTKSNTIKPQFLGKWL